MGVFDVAFAAIICGAIVSIYESKRRAQKQKNYSPDINKHQQEIEQLKSRIAALEAIVTDSNYQLKKEFERL
ncbi:hypothetical protein [Flocculibacter collagenilyticus]|uniref:hypothetical protein n=1 Tax=Flocculibacter collagenilyticus TaxID=2744479 RepID=UPI0018F6517E|nr:hypothetical protein [Flocculibacter collagenilyticus]